MGGNRCCHLPQQGVCQYSNLSTRSPSNETSNTAEIFASICHERRCSIPWGHGTAPGPWTTTRSLGCRLIRWNAQQTAIQRCTTHLPDHLERGRLAGLLRRNWNEPVSRRPVSHDDHAHIRISAECYSLDATRGRRDSEARRRRRSNDTVTNLNLVCARATSLSLMSGTEYRYSDLDASHDTHWLLRSSSFVARVHLSAGFFMHRSRLFSRAVYRWYCSFLVCTAPRLIMHDFDFPQIFWPHFLLVKCPLLMARLQQEHWAQICGSKQN